MDEIKNTKTANQAWRRKPRKFAPKSRLGCKTCKIRRVKCDLSRPSCLKCQSTGRTCDGFNETPPTFEATKTEIELSHFYSGKADRGENYGPYRPCPSATIADQPQQRQPNYPSLILQNLRPFMILPGTGSAEAEAMCFFEYTSIKHLNELRPSESWRKTLMFFSQTIPSVRHAAVALALIHRNHLDRDSSGHVHQVQSSRNPPPDMSPLLHYNRAIQLLLSRESGDGTETIAITLLVCYLFICFDHAAGNYVRAVKHLRGGVELSRNIDKAMLHNSTYNDAESTTGAHTLVRQVTRQIRRLDMQAVMFLVDWTPVDIQETFVFQLPPSDSAFRSLDQAADHLQILITRVMRLCNTGQQLSPVGEMPPPPSSLKGTLLGQLATWSRLFENMVQQDTSHGTDLETYRLVSLMRLQHTIAWILLGTCGPGREMDYDDFLPQFEQCLALASEVAAAHERYSGSLKPTSTPETGIVPALYIIGAKCRDPIVRREILCILRRQPIREAVWDSIVTARVLERIIEIEEGGSGKGERAQGMEQVAACQRIEAVSWIHVVGGQSAAKLDITYTFCTREGTHTESLL